MFHPNAKGHTYFSEPHGMFSKTDHILGHKVILNRYKKIEITHCILLDHHRLKLDIHNRNKVYNHIKTEQFSTEWKMGQDRNKDIKDFLKFNENEYIAYSSLWVTIKTALRGTFIALWTYIETKQKILEISY